MISKFDSDFSLPRRGFSLVETAIVLGIFSVILGATWMVTGNVRENVRREQASEQITIVMNNVRALYQGKASITGAFSTLTSDLIEKGAIPADMVRNRSAATKVADHPWGAVAANGTALAAGGFGVAAEPNRQSFRIRLFGLARETCIAMAMKISNSTGATGLQSILINGVTMTMPLGLVAAQAQCTAANNNTVDYVFRLRQMGR